MACIPGARSASGKCQLWGPGRIGSHSSNVAFPTADATLFLQHIETGCLGTSRRPGSQHAISFQGLAYQSTLDRDPNMVYPRHLFVSDFMCLRSARSM